MADLDDYVARLVADAPPLHAEQVERLAVLLRDDVVPRPTRGTTLGQICPRVAHDVSSAGGHEGGRHG